VANFLDKMLDAADSMVGGMEKSAKFAEPMTPDDIDNSDAIDAEFTEVKTPVETPSKMASFKDGNTQDSSHRIEHLRIDLYNALGTCKGTEKEEFRKLITEIHECLKLGI